MAISDATIEADRLKDFLKSFGNATVNFGKKVACNPLRALVIPGKIRSAAATKNRRATVAATTDSIEFATTGEEIKLVEEGRGLYLGTKKKYY